MTDTRMLPVHVEPVEDIEFRLALPAEENDEDLLFFDADLDDSFSDDTGSGEFVYAESLSQARRYLKNWLRNFPDDEREPQAGRAYDDIVFAMDNVEWDSDDMAVLSIGEWCLLYGHPSWSLARTISDNSEATYEAEFSDRLIAFKPSESGGVIIRDMLRDLGVTMTSRANTYLGGNKTSVSHTEENARKAIDLGFRAPDEFPSGRSLKPHQEIAVLSLAFNGGGLLADQVGLGKGGEFTCAWETFKRYHEDHGRRVGPCVVSVTKSMVDEIANEIMMWTDDPTIVILQGRKSSYIDPDADYILLNHDILASRVDEIIEMRPSGFIADECHVFKNEEAQRTKAAMALSDAIRSMAEPYDINEDVVPEGDDKVEEVIRKAAFICMASGTPFLNTPVELWSILKIIGVASKFSDYALKVLPSTTTYWRRVKGGAFVSRQAKFSPKRAFETYFCDGHYDKYHSWWNTGASHIEELNELLITGASMVRRRKSDVMHPMPDITENVIYTDLSDEYMEMYRQAATDFAEFYVGNAKDEALANDWSVKRAVQIALSKLNTSEMFMQIGALRKIASNGKADFAINWIDDFLSGKVRTKHEDGHEGPVSDDPTRRKLIVFTHFRDTRAAIMESEVIAKYNPVFILPGGETTGEEIQEAKRLFQEDPDTRLIICSMSAREGHTLTASKDVLVVDMPYTPSWVVQIAGRCWARFSEHFDPHEAYIHYMIAERTIDNNILTKSRMKKKTFDAIIDNEGIDDLNSEDDIPSETLVADMVEGIVEIGIAR